ncbi:MAG: RHS repeat-associated core domain-containing protein [Sphingomonadaceae bacterium]|nr:RHS repeat-associated core domain-containing protein [Sphingomonadaceae bacterium]
MRARNFLLTTAAILPAAFVSAPLAAQSITLAPPPVRQPLDENGVDLSSGEIIVPSSVVAIGGADGLIHTRSRVSNGWRHNYILSIASDTGANGTTYIVQIGGSAREFDEDNGSYTPVGTETGTLTETATEFIYVDGGGTEYRFSKTLVANGESYYEAVEAVGTLITTPAGNKTTLTYRGDSYSFNGNTIYTVRLQSVTNNAGYQLKYEYVADTPSSNDQGDSWYDIDRVTAINNAEEYCDPSADSCTLTGDWPYLAYSRTGYNEGTTLGWHNSVTDILGREAKFKTGNYGELVAVKRPGEADYGMVIGYDAPGGRVASITHQGTQTRSYSWSENTTTEELTSVSTDSLGRTRTVVTDMAEGLVKSATDALGNTTSYSYDANGWPDEITAPEGNKVSITRDARGRVTKVTHIAKPGSGLANIETLASYPALTSGISCSNTVNCDKPITTTDARGKVTNYTYDATHGGVTQVKLPQDAGGIRPQTDFTYTTQYARIKNSSGTLVQSPDGIVRPDTVTRCRTAAACSGTANEQVIDLAYNNTSAENLQPVSVTRKAGNGTLAQTTAITYDPLGNVLTVDGPLTGTVDTSRNHYDVAGQLIGSVGPDPDGAGTLPRLASRVTYNDDGQVTIAESGTVTGQSEADFANFSPQTKSVTSYDEFGRVETVAQVGTVGNTQYSIAQYSYDASGRPECTALRMNAPYTSTTLPADACTAMTAGSYGEDRISRTYYDAADRVTSVFSGVGTDLQQQSVEMSYNDNGTVAWVEDAADNRTAYSYDGHDRSYKVTYPSDDTPHTTDATNYEQVTYDAGGNILTHRTRAGETFSYAYDDLGRVTVKDVPTRSGLAATHTRDVYFGYDLFGAMTYARFDSASGEGIDFAYNALGQLTSTTQNLDSTSRTLAYQYDVAGRQTRVTHPDGAYWQYLFDDMGRLKYVRDQANKSLITQLYQAYGPISRRTREGSAPDDFFFYDSAKRMDHLRTTHPTSSYTVNQEWTFNPAHQATTEELDNQLYAWNGHPASNSQTAYSANGLNQITQAGANAYSYDGNGNLTSDSLTSYVYDTENRLVGASGQNTVGLRYDPLGRLYEIDDGNGGVRRLLYDGDALVAEYNTSGTMLDRYVHGLSAGDDPLVRYAGSGTSYLDAEYLYTDRLGSVIARYQRDGTPVAINSYDEYGVPGQSTGIYNNGRFRYTGQIWIPELGQYYYKARMYSPTIGRFMQTDPIGYADGMNIYRYVGNDPVNFVDPTGTEIVVNGYKTCPIGWKCLSGDELADLLREWDLKLTTPFGPQFTAFTWKLLLPPLSR